jgi:hypothetical protein
MAVFIHQAKVSLRPCVLPLPLASMQRRQFGFQHVLVLPSYQRAVGGHAGAHPRDAKTSCGDILRPFRPERRAINQLLDGLRDEIMRMDRSVSGFNIGANSGESAGQTVGYAHVHLIPRRAGDVEKPRSHFGFLSRAVRCGGGVVVARRCRGSHSARQARIDRPVKRRALHPLPLPRLTTKVREGRGGFEERIRSRHGRASGTRFSYRRQPAREVARRRKAGRKYRYRLSGRDARHNGRRDRLGSACAGACS